MIPLLQPVSENIYKHEILLNPEMRNSDARTHKLYMHM